MKILFVCLGNICRSPTAEAVFKQRLRKLNIQAHVDSAGTSSNHVGEDPDPRSQTHAIQRGYRLEHKARQFKIQDFDFFDHILVMDRSNKNNVLKLTQSPQHHKKVTLLTDFIDDSTIDEVPDPYYGGDAGFQEVIDIIEMAFEGFSKKHFTF